MDSPFFFIVPVREKRGRQKVGSREFWNRIGPSTWAPEVGRPFSWVTVAKIDKKNTSLLNEIKIEKKIQKSNALQHPPKS